MKQLILNSGAVRARKKFLRYFPEGFRDQTYIDWERGYKENAHKQWNAVLDRLQFKALLEQKKLFSFEKMALRDLRSRDMIDIQSFIWVQGSMNTEINSCSCS